MEERYTFTHILLLTFLQLSFIQSGSAQLPALGSVSTYAAFTSYGAFSNTGPSFIRGDIGTNGGALTGFPQGTLTGTIHVVDSSSNKAASAVDSLYFQLSASPSDSTLSHTLGNGQFLAPGTYTISSAASLSGNIVLDAKGNHNALFIFQINGALNVMQSASITLLDSASSSHIFWQINGDFALADSTVFKGIIAVNGAINLSSGSSLYGKALSRQGAINLNSSSVKTNFFGSEENPLPIVLLSFRGACDKSNVLLAWSTASETNSSYYTLEKSTAGIRWQIVGMLQGKGNSSTQSNYSFTDKQSADSVSYYRLLETDKNGMTQNFSTISVTNCQIQLPELTLYPNPSSGICHLQVNEAIITPYSIYVYDSYGKLVQSLADSPSSIDFSNLERGIYFLHVTLPLENDRIAVGAGILVLQATAISFSESIRPS